MEWRPIKTVPKNGSRFLAKDRLGQIGIYFWKTRNEWGYEGIAYNYNFFSYIFHTGLEAWHPLPA